MKEIIEVLFENIDRVKVENRAISVPPSYRTIYKITQILLIINHCCAPRKGCSMLKLQIISNAISSDESFEELMNFLTKESKFIVVRFDPMVNRAILYALGEKLIIVQKNKLYRLTSKGKEYVNLINSYQDVFTFEKKILDRISYSLTEDKIEELVSGWRWQSVKN